MTDVMFTVYAGFFGAVLLVSGVALAKSAFPPPEIHRFPDGDPEAPIWCHGCDHVHRRDQMGWNEDDQFRCSDCCSPIGQLRRDIKLAREYGAATTGPQWRERQFAEFRRQAREEAAAYRASAEYCIRCGIPHMSEKCGRR